MTQEQPFLLLDNVSVKATSGQLLVSNVSCELDSGKIMAIIGPNGAGKSSLLKAICDDMPYSGEIKIRGLADTDKLRARQVSVLPQLSLLNFPYRVAEVVRLGRIPHTTGRQSDDQIVKEALELMDISFLTNRLYTELSGGEKQRVQLARVLAQIWNSNDAPANSRLLLLDEPTSALDLGHQQQLMNAIRKLAEQDVTVVMVLHDINLAAHYADRILALQCSERLAFGNVEEVITPPNIKSLFGINAKVIKHPEHQTPVVIDL